MAVSVDPLLLATTTTLWSFLTAEIPPETPASRVPEFTTYVAVKPSVLRTDSRLELTDVTVPL